MSDGLYVFYSGSNEIDPDGNGLFYDFWNGNNWSGERQVPLTNTTNNPSPIAVFGDLYCFHQGNTGNGQLWCNTYDGVRWLGDKQIAASPLSSGPSACLFQGQLYCFYSGSYGSAQSGNALLYNVYDGTTWLGEKAVPLTNTSQTPSAVVYNGKLYCFHQGNTNNGQLWYNVFDGESWAGDKQVAASKLSSGPSACYFNGRLFCAYSGSYGADNVGNALLYNIFDGSAWAGEAQVPLTNTSKTPAAITFGDKVYCFHEGNTSNGQLWYNVFDGANWAGDKQIAASPLSAGPGIAQFQVPVSTVTSVTGDNAYAFLSISVTDSTPPPQAVTLTLAEGSPYLTACICQADGGFAYPTGATVTLTDPAGTVYNTDTSTDTLFVQTNGSGSTWVAVIANPLAGDWSVAITAPEGVNFLYSMTALPSTDVVGTIVDAMQTIMPPPPTEDTVTSRSLTAQANSATIDWYWYGVPALAAVAGAVALGALPLTAPVVLGSLAVAGAISLIASYSTTQSQQFIGASSQTSTSQATASTQTSQAAVQSKPLAEAVAAAIAKVGTPSTTDPADFASRADMGVDENYFIQLDIAGEGFYREGGNNYGFIDAINLNALTTNTLTGKAIPMLVQLPSFDTNPPYPFVDKIANYITMQNAPLTDTNVAEITRLIRPGGRVDLWIDQERFRAQLSQLAANLKCTPVMGDDTLGWTKASLVNNNSA